MLRPVLLAEDNANDVELTIAALRASQLDNEVVVVPDGAQALDFLHRRGEFAGSPLASPAVVLLDLRLPRVDGLEVLREIRATPALRSLPVVILSSSRVDGEVHQAYAQGANAYVVKPVHCDRFVNVVAEIAAFWVDVNEPPPVAAVAG
jgi:CheY-like chemotaxis protein